MSTRPLQPPGSTLLANAIDRSEPLARLLQRLEQSRARYAAVASILPPGLRDAVRAGPIDEEGWSLLAAHGAAAAKLRQLLPRIEMVLRAKGWPDLPIKVRIQPLQPLQ